MGAVKTATAETAATAIPYESGLSFHAPTLDLKRATALLARVADRKSTMPMLQNVCMRVSETATTLTATDLNVSAVVRMPWSGKVGGFAVNAKALADVVKKLPPGDVEISRKGGLGLALTSGSLASVLHGSPDRDFPKVPNTDDLPWHEVPAQDLAELLDGVAFSVCKDETRFHLNGTLYENPTGEHATFVSTDGHRLTKIQRKLAGPPTKGVIIPSKGASEIVKLLSEGKRKGTCEMAIHTPHVFVRYGAVTLIVKTIDAQFPPYEQVIPKDHSRLATVERKPLIDVLKRCATVASETRGVKLTLASGKLTVTCDHPDLGSASETMPAEGNFAGTFKTDQWSIGFNPKYLLDLLGEIDCKHVTFAFDGDDAACKWADGHPKSALSPVLVRSTEHAVSYSVADAPFVGVVMPMRI